MSLSFRRDNVDRLLEFNEQLLLSGAGSVRHDEMKQVVHARYEIFEKSRRAAEASQADADDLEAIEQFENQIQGKKA